MPRMTHEHEPATALTAALAQDPKGPLGRLRAEAERIVLRACLHSDTYAQAAERLGISERTLRRLRRSLI